MEPLVDEIVRDTYTETIFLPLHSENHWTLLTLTYPNMQWNHYDPLRPMRSNERNNSSYAAAVRVVK